MSVWDGVSIRGALPDGTVTRIRFRLSPLQRLQYGLAMALPFLGFGMFFHLRYGDPYPLGFWWSPAFFTLFFTLMQSSERTELNERFLVVPTAFGSREVPWGAIRAVRSERLLGSRYVKIQLVDGKSRRLRVPISGFPYDRDFERKFGTIETWWALRRGW